MHTIEAQIRKQQNILICSGIGMILFGIWSIIRLVLMRYINESQFISFFRTVEGIPESTYEQLVFIIVLVLLSIDLIVRFYIGRSAINESRGIYKKHVTYIVIAALYAFSNILGDLSQIPAFVSKSITLYEFMDDIIDITINIATIEIVIAAIKVRKLEKKSR